MGRPLCRLPLSVDLASQPPPAVASGEIVTPALEPSCHKRARRKEIGGDSGRIEDDRCSPQLKPMAGETRAEDPVHPEVPTDVVPHLAAAPETDSTPVEETTPTGIVTPHLLLPKTSRWGTTLLSTCPPTHPVKKVCARPQREPRKRPRYARGPWNSRGQLPRLLPASSLCQACRMRCLRLGRGLA
jgi:hypothetical protein